MQNLVNCGLNKVLIGWHEVSEWSYDFSGQEVECQTESDGERQSRQRRQRTSEDGQKH